ncbi:MAG: hypothetical protein P8Y70_09845 [Candidatus Lokiarchaeota archaeon]
MKKLLILFIFGFSVFIGGSFAIGIYGFAANGYVEDSFNYSYETSQLNSTQDLHFRMDVGNVYIEYNNSKMEEAMMADMRIYLSGPFINGKKYTDYFNPVIWQNTPTSANLSLKEFNNNWPGKDDWFYRDGSTLRIKLRTDLTYNISVYSEEGNIEVHSPKDVNINKINLTTSIGDVSLYANRTIFNNKISIKSNTGNIFLNFTKCIIDGSIRSVTFTGDTHLNTYHPYYTETSNWEINTTNGDIIVNINQNENMNSDVDASFQSHVGNVVVNYHDNSTQVGALFSGSSGINVIKYESKDGSFGKFRNEFKSIDYDTAINKYSIDMKTFNGDIVVRATSSPD